jgi:hypothetical protein
MTKRFKDFNIEYLLESVLEVSPEFKKIISGIKTSSGLERYIIDWVDNRSDIKTNYNLLGPGDSSDKILYLQDRQYQRFKETGVDVSTRTKIDSNVGRLVRSILNDNGIKFTEPQVEEFVNAYKAAWNKIYNPREFDIVKGEDIKFWYLSDNYYRGGQSTLGNSCMRYASKNNRLEIYSQNPDKVSMMIFTDYEPGSDVKKLLARALIWKTDDGSIYCDRIYSNSDEIFTECKSWLKSKYPDAIYHSESPGKVVVTLNKVLFDKYPYMDTLMWLVHDLVDGKLVAGTGVLHSEQPNAVDGKIIFKLRNHRYGTPEHSYIYIEKLDRYYTPDEIVHTHDRNLVWPKNLCVYSDLYKGWIIQDEAVESTFHNAWISKQVATDILDLGLVDSNYVNIGIVKYLGNQKDYPWIKLDRLIEQNIKDYMQLEVFGKYDQKDYIEINADIPVTDESPLGRAISRYRWFAPSDVVNVPSYGLWPKMFCIDVWNINWNKIQKKFYSDINLIISDINKFVYNDTILKIDAKLLGIEDCIEEPKFLNVFDSIWYNRSYWGSEDDLLNFEELEKSSQNRITEGEKRWRISLIQFSQKIYKDLYDDVKEKIEKLKRATDPQNLSKFINIVKSEIEEKLNSGLLDEIREDFSEWRRVNGCSEEDLIKIYKLYQLIYLLLGDTGKTRNFIISQRSKYGGLIYKQIPVLENIGNLLEFRQIFYNNHAGQIHMQKKNTSNISSDDVYNYILFNSDFLGE